jgi:hypothetical protein
MIELTPVNNCEAKSIPSSTGCGTQGKTTALQASPQEQEDSGQFLVKHLFIISKGRVDKKK